MNGCVIATYRCNARCHMCGIWHNPSTPQDELAATYLDRLPGGLGRINLTGREPMLRDDIEDLVDILYGKAAKVEISTNGYYTEKILSIAHHFPKVMFRISLEGLPELNDRLRGTQNGFDHALRTMLGLLDSPARDIGFSVVICDKNADDLLALYRLCAALGVEFGNSVMHNSWYFHKNDNYVQDVEKSVAAEKAFIKELLESPRHGLKLRVKYYLRSYFNINILNHLQGGDNILLVALPDVTSFSLIHGETFSPVTERRTLGSWEISRRIPFRRYGTAKRRRRRAPLLTTVVGRVPS